uniref:PARP catalytic domain-containing protein n=1 Tax=viral metagenome TaxID=1070528 RepID=A0A6C0CYK3_9ZZZZ
MKPIMKKYDIYYGTSHMKKADLVCHICSNIKFYIRSNQRLKLEIVSDFNIPKDMLNKYLVFYKLKNTMILASNERISLNRRDIKIKQNIFKAIIKFIQVKKTQKAIKEKCEEIELMNENDILDIVEKETKYWGNDITFELSPHIDKLEQHNLHYKIEKEYGGFDESHEKILYHGCDEKTKDSILKDGNFSLLMCGKKHGSRFGPGIYLTDKLWKAVQYSETQKKFKHYKYVLVCKVLVKNIKPALSYEITFGSKTNNNSKDELYDTGVDNISDPIEYIKKNSNQICILGFMKLFIDKRNCKLLNTSFNSITGSVSQSMVYIRFINKYGHYGDYVCIYWINPSGAKILMNKQLMYDAATSIRTMVNHQFKIYSYRNNQLIMTKFINQTDILNSYVIIA